MKALELSELTVRFGHGSSAVTAVDNVSLAISQGSVLGLVGESGSGKSTLARAVAGLIKPTSGTVMVNGLPLGPRRLAHRGPGPLQMVFQDPSSSLNPRMTVGRAIQDALLARGVKAKDRSAETRRLLDLVALHSETADRLPSDLSGGQRQRVAIARGIATNPSVLICDEITSALDVSVQGAILNLISDLRRELGLTILFISHNLAVVRHVSDDVAVMRHGVLVETGPAVELLEHPHEDYTRELIDAIPDPSQPITARTDAAEFSFLKQH